MCVPVASVFDDFSGVGKASLPAFKRRKNHRKRVHQRQHYRSVLRGSKFTQKFRIKEIYVIRNSEYKNIWRWRRHDATAAWDGGLAGLRIVSRRSGRIQGVSVTVVGTDDGPDNASLTVHGNPLSQCRGGEVFPHRIRRLGLYYYGGSIVLPKYNYLC